MKLYIMRHGQAQTTARSDQSRALTAEGIQETQIMAQWLAEREPNIALSFTSPYVRAQQTYETLAQYIDFQGDHYCLNELSPETTPAFCGDSLLAYCAQHQVATALAVSHLPLVALLVSDLCNEAMLPEFTTASIACIEVDVDNWQGNLLWHRKLAQST